MVGELFHVTMEVEEEVVGEEDGEIVLDSHQQHRKQNRRKSIENLRFHLLLQRQESRWHFLMTQEQVTSRGFFSMMNFSYQVVIQTNLYVMQYKRNNANLPRHSQAQSWFDTSRGEMKKFIAFSLLMGIVRKLELSDYWSTNPLSQGSVFNSVMSRNCFWHFADNS